MRHYHRTYEREERAAHEAAFNKNYPLLLKLKKEGHDVQINERLDWTPTQKTSTFLFTFRFLYLQALGFEYPSLDQTS